LKLVACMMLLLGFFIVLVALVLLTSVGERSAFIAAGLGVEIQGLALLTQAYRTHRKEHR